MTRTEAIAALQDWSGPASSEQRHDTSERVAFALRLWNAALPLAGTLGERYLGRDSRHRRDPAAADDPRGAALPPQLSLRGESTPPLHRRPHARPADGCAGRDSSHRPGAGERQGQQARPHGARPHGRREALAGRRPARGRRRHRDHARRRDTHLLPGRSPDAGLVGGGAAAVSAGCRCCPTCSDSFCWSTTTRTAKARKPLSVAGKFGAPWDATWCRWCRSKRAGTSTTWCWGGGRERLRRRHRGDAGTADRGGRAAISARPQTHARGLSRLRAGASVHLHAL